MRAGGPSGGADLRDLLPDRKEVPVSDSPEFIRNVNLVEDMLEVTGVKRKITEKIKELKEFFDKLFKK